MIVKFKVADVSITNTTLCSLELDHNIYFQQILLLVFQNASCNWL